MLPVFAGLSPSQLERPAALFKSVAFPAGAAIFAAGDRASSLYVVQSGEVVIRFHPYDGEALDIATVTAGSAFGWSAAFRRSYYTSSAICRTDVIALAMEARDLHQIMSDDPQLARTLLERASQAATSRFDGLGRQVIQLLKPKNR
ncbi:MAG: cyclic nucleotide-binding domain-containing protein [Anaerolineales bacterium]